MAAPARRRIAQAWRLTRVKETIVALSSGAPPAAIAVLRLSGGRAVAAAQSLAGPLPPLRRAAVRTLRDGDGEVLDRALVLRFAAPASATGEDVVELHCHGGRAVVAAVLAALLACPGVREAEPGEFTRRALTTGRVDLAQAEGLADLLEAETEMQRRVAMAAAEGRVSRAVGNWIDRLANLSAAVEAAIDFAEEEDVAIATASLDPVIAGAAALRAEMEAVLAAPPVERIRDGVKVVLGGPPNSGKSTLFNLLVEREAAIVSPIAGTTRDRVEAPARRGGVAYLLIDTAGLTETDDTVERIGVGRAEAAIVEADILLWLGDDLPPRGDALWVQARGDLPGRTCAAAGRILVRQDDARTIDRLWQVIAERAGTLMPSHHVLPLKREQRARCSEAVAALAHLAKDPLLIAEDLRQAHRALTSILGIDATESMLDALFERFCLGK